jgi:hypothetical protein
MDVLCFLDLHGQQQPSYPMTKRMYFLVFFLHPEAPPIQILLALLCGMPQALFCLIDLFLQEDSGIVVVVDSFDLCLVHTFVLGGKIRRSIYVCVCVCGTLEENSFVLFKTTFWS